MTNPAGFMNFVALAAIAAVTVTQMLRARNNPSGQPLADAFDPDDKPLLIALCKDYEGEAPTERQKNPHPPDTLAFASWIKELEREVRELRQANEILKKASAYFAQAELDRPFRK